LARGTETDLPYDPPLHGRTKANLGSQSYTSFHFPRLLPPSLSKPCLSSRRKKSGLAIPIFSSQKKVREWEESGGEEKGPKPYEGRKCILGFDIFLEF
jgi:hypothetical protein